MTEQLQAIDTEAKPKRTAKRRGRGQGAVFLRGDGRWAASITIGHAATGKRIRRTVYGSTSAEVQEKLSELHSQRRAGRLTAATRQTVGAYLVSWLASVEPPSVRATTHLCYKCIIDTHIVPRIGTVGLQKLTALDVEEMYAAMKRAGCSPRRQQLAHAVLRMALKKAAKLRLVSRNVCEDVDAPKAPKATIRPLDRGQTDLLLASAAGERFEALFILAVTTGLRQGELFGLQWPDVDLERGVLAVRQTLVEISGRLSTGQPKSQAGRRSVKLPKVAIDAILDHRKRMLAEGHAGASFVFCDSEGGPLRKSNFERRVWKPLLAKAALPHFRFHDLRHTAATLLLAAGEHPKIVQERLGHSQISLTMDTYSHVLDGMQNGAADKLDRMFGKAVG